MTTKLREQVAEFHRVFGQEIRETPGIPDEATVRLRGRLVIEEAFEFVDALLEAKVDKDFGRDVWRRPPRRLHDLPLGRLLHHAAWRLGHVAGLHLVRDALAVEAKRQPRPFRHVVDVRERVGHRDEVRSHRRVPEDLVDAVPQVQEILRRQGWMNG
jgi:hypothetical protein